MAVVKVGNTDKYYREDYIGVAADVKPTTCAPGSTFFEKDTGNWYMYDGTAWINNTKYSN